MIQMLRKSSMTRTVMAGAASAAAICVGLSGLLTGSAQAGISELGTEPVTFRDAFERSDGSLVVTGRTGDILFEKDDPDRRKAANLVVGLDRYGTLIPDFGNGGITLIPLEPDEIPYEVMSRPEGGFLSVTSSRLRAYGADGNLEPGFAQSGQISLPGLIGVATSSSSIFTAQRVGAVTRVGKFTLAGEPDPEYGTEGFSEVPFEARVAPAVDSKERVVLAGEDGAKRQAFRLDDEGKPDTTFGTHGTGAADLVIQPPSPAYIFFEALYRVEILAGDGVRVYFSEIPQPYSQRFLTTDLNEDGEPPVPFPLGSAGNINYRDEGPFEFLLAGHAVDATPGEGWNNNSIELSDGTVLGVGGAGGHDCRYRCQYRVMGMVALADGTTGNLVPGFGSGGVRLIPGNTCSWGLTAVELDWKVCRVAPPRIQASAKLNGTTGLRPRLELLATPGTPPPDFRGTAQRLEVSLPGNLRLLKGWKRKVKLWVSDGDGTSKRVPVEFTGSQLFAQYIPVLPPDWEYETDLTDPQLTFRVVIRRGAIGRVGRKVQRRGLKTKVRAEFVPRGYGSYAPNSKTRSVRVKLK